MLCYAIRPGFINPEWIFLTTGEPLTAEPVSFSEGLTRLMDSGTPARAGTRSDATLSSRDGDVPEIARMARLFSGLSSTDGDVPVFRLDGEGFTDKPQDGAQIPKKPRMAYLFRDKFRNELLVPADWQVLPPFGGTKILCVGRNYRPHAEELGNPLPSEPLWFTKPPSSLLADGGSIELPTGFGRIDYEGELALVLGRRLRRAGADEALAAIAAVTPALDITARELQKADGQWTRAKGFDTFCPLGPVLAPYSPAWSQARLEVRKNGELMQSDGLTSLVFPFGVLISHLSQCMTLEPGDVILTGTPAGVGPLVPGDRLEVLLVGPQTLRLTARVAAPGP
jgi:2-keto-4-pentenoate hydratase/2-oxohepta-3-ene-1,7-dioic acid hydratase in catechol pathway